MPPNDEPAAGLNPVIIDGAKNRCDLFFLKKKCVYSSLRFTYDKFLFAHRCRDEDQRRRHSFE